MSATMAAPAGPARKPARILPEISHPAASLSDPTRCRPKGAHRNDRVPRRARGRRRDDLTDRSVRLTGQGLAARNEPSDMRLVPGQARGSEPGLVIIGVGGAGRGCQLAGWRLTWWPRASSFPIRRRVFLSGSRQWVSGLTR
jgi:hypothetical protein